MPYLVYRKHNDGFIPEFSFLSALKLAFYLKMELGLSEDYTLENLELLSNAINCDVEIECFYVQCRENFSFQEIADFYGEDVSATRQRFRRSLIKMRTDRVGKLLREFAARMERKNDSQYIFGLN